MTPPLTAHEIKRFSELTEEMLGRMAADAGLPTSVGMPHSEIADRATAAAYRHRAIGELRSELHAEFAQHTGD